MSFRDLLDTEELQPPSRTAWPYLVAALVIGLVVIGGWAVLRSGTESVPDTEAGPGATAASGSPAATTGPVVATTAAEPEGPPDLTLPLPPSEDVEIPTDDGLILIGRLYPGGPTAVLLGHSYDTGQGAVFDSEQILPVAGGFARAGYTVLAFDHRGHGRSPGEASQQALAGDMTAAFRLLRERGAGEIYVVAWGASGTAAIIAGAEGNIDPAGVVGLFVRPQFLGLDAQAVIGVTDENFLFISVDAGRTTNWARILVGAAPEGSATLEELPAPPTGSDPVTAFWPAVVERSLQFFADVSGD